MNTSDRPSDESRTYLLDPESATEMARLTLQERLATQAMGGLFPERSDVSRLHQVLDVGCGPGGWAIDLALTFPDSEVVGIDISDTMLTYARAQAAVHGLTNMRFERMNALQSWQFADGSFDLINIRSAVGYIPRTSWPTLLQECVRTLRPGGTIRLTEGDVMGFTNSFAFERLNAFCMQLIWNVGYGFSPTGSTLGITPMLEKLLQDAGCQHIQMRPHVLNFSYGTPFYISQRQNLSVAFKSLQPLFIKWNITTQDEVERLYEDMLVETGQETFRALCYFITAWGETPL